MTVYVITHGEYSSYSICGVTLDKNRAEKMAKFYSDTYAKAVIEEYETDAEDSDVLDNLIPVYYVHIDKDGKYTIDVDSYTDGRKPYEPSFNLYDYGGFFMAFLTAKDKEHALKIALDERAKRMAERYGVV